MLLAARVATKRLVTYTRDLDWEFDRRWRQPDARAQVRVDENDVSLEVEDVDGIWWMSLDGGPEVEIPGGRSWTVDGWTAGRRKTRDRYGERWLVISRAVAEGLEPLRDWCRIHAESSIIAEGFWLRARTWSERREDGLPLPWIPEFDASRLELRRVARAEREHREMIAMAKFLAEERRQAVAEAVGRGRSRRDIAAVIGLSVARVQQIIKGR